MDIKQTKAKPENQRKITYIYFNKLVYVGDFLQLYSKQLRLYLCLILPNLLGLITAIANFSSIHGLVKSIVKPPFTLPTFLLVLAWIVLYVVVGYASFLVLNTRAFQDEKIKALLLCAGQLLLHSLWVTCFFKYHWYFLSFLLHVGYLALTFGNMALYRQLHKQAGNLMIAYFAYSAYFTYLNFVSIFLN